MGKFNRISRMVGSEDSEAPENEETKESFGETQSMFSRGKNPLKDAMLQKIYENPSAAIAAKLLTGLSEDELADTAASEASPGLMPVVGSLNSAKSRGFMKGMGRLMGKEAPKEIERVSTYAKELPSEIEGVHLPVKSMYPPDKFTRRSGKNMIDSGSYSHQGGTSEMGELNRLKNSILQRESELKKQLSDNKMEGLPLFDKTESINRSLSEINSIKKRDTDRAKDLIYKKYLENKPVQLPDEGQLELFKSTPGLRSKEVVDEVTRLGKGEDFNYLNSLPDKIKGGYIDDEDSLLQNILRKFKNR